MPELPEVEAVRRVLEKALKGRRLVEVRPRLDDRIMYDRATPAEVRDALTGAKVTGAGRRGKYLWLELDRRPWPVIHFGMTGKVEVISSRLKSFGSIWEGASIPAADTATDALPKFCKLLLVADDGARAAFLDARRFGRIRLAEDPLKEPPISELGPDPIVGDFPSAKELAKTLAKRKAPIKAVLLDQGLFAGVGNWIADEVLFQARLSPNRLASKLSAAEVARLRTKLLEILRKAISVHADYERYPRTWLFHYRWGRKAGALAHGQRKIRHDDIGGRTTAWVPELQK
jgi:formamidopyrimidine-DNA glycosylase